MALDDGWDDDVYFIDVDEEDGLPQVFRCCGSIVLVAPDGHFEGIVTCDWADVRDTLERDSRCPECGSDDVTPAFAPKAIPPVG